jgi:hypothetical protein
VGSESARALGEAQVKHAEHRRYMRDTLEDVLSWFETGLVDGIYFDEQSIIDIIRESLAVNNVDKRND